MLTTKPSGMYYKIEDLRYMPPFFINVASAGDVWMYLSSNGAPAAGRQNAGYSIFPYETDDRLHLAGSTGPKTLVRVNGRIWEPFNAGHDNPFDIERSLYKRVSGDAVMFEEINRDWGLAFSYRWETSEKYGLVRTAEIVNIGGAPLQAEVLDGVENIIPYGIQPSLAQGSSCLTDAYKVAERPDEGKLAVFYLTSAIGDSVEPIEVLQANIAWHVGDAETYLLSSRQIMDFAVGKAVENESQSNGRKCAFMTVQTIELAPNGGKTWLFVFDSKLNQCDVSALSSEINRESNNTLRKNIEADIKKGTDELVRIVAAADGMQHTADENGCIRHYMNVLYNNMRGGVFLDGYALDLNLFENFFAIRNKVTAKRRADFLQALRDDGVKDIIGLQMRAFADGDPDLVRLCMEFLPLTFSRRHGDPSRPWNYFNIRVKDDDGNHLYHYEGNWRDIFQNWEALCLSFPGYIAPIIAKFLNASTADGFNPYRINHEGIDWEIPVPNDPWAGIGYWGDHQIVYLTKLLEWMMAYAPDTLKKLTQSDAYTYSDVPYEIVPYTNMMRDSKRTIRFNAEKHDVLMARAKRYGTDGKLIMHGERVHHVSFTEKLLVPILAKLSNLVIGGGIWMNTQRPEWNDANNAIVGNGMSMVTVYQLYRHLGCCVKIMQGMDASEITLYVEIKDWFAKIYNALNGRANLTPRAFLDKAGAAFCDYRGRVYAGGFVKSGNISTKEVLTVKEIIAFFEAARQTLGETIDMNKREDGMYHSYNILTLTESGLEIAPMFLMLEGQTAVLGSGKLNAEDALALTQAMEASDLFNPQAKQFFLYPMKTLKSFLERNTIPSYMVTKSPFLVSLLNQGHEGFIVKDAAGQARFHHTIRQSRDVDQWLNALKTPPQDAAYIRELYEHVFAHKQFTGRSGIMYKYEGIGCIYWHQNAKFMLSLQEAFIQAVKEDGESELTGALRDAYYRLQEGFGFRKTPREWGAFPLEPYSHSPYNMPAQQPGMTGQVKEDILTRLAELGVMAEGGVLTFGPSMLKPSEFFKEPTVFRYINAANESAELPLPADSLAFTVCQVPVVYRLAPREKITVYSNGQPVYESDTLALDKTQSHALFIRDGSIDRIEICIEKFAEINRSL
ncbi:MAG: hypothetical protein FWD90_07845 [Defluviitaleaceae bacterium]|nr:hypothetical protein [Defluviitaleaceae bacterium]